MPDPKPDTPYTLAELAAFAEAGLRASGLSQRAAAEYLNEHHPTETGAYHQPQNSGALRDPERNPRMVTVLVEAFTNYTVHPEALYVLRSTG